MMQRPTCTGLRIRTPADAHVVFHAVSLDMLPIVSRRLDTEERRAITSGCVFVWEERGPNTEATGLGIERWTDSIRWGPSRVRDEFLYYQERERETPPLERESASDSDIVSPARAQYPHGPHRENLIKQTYSVFVDTLRGRRKWHLIAYFTYETLDFLCTIDDYPQLASLNVPPGKYKTARSAKPSRVQHPSLDTTLVQIGYTTNPTRYLPYEPDDRRYVRSLRPEIPRTLQNPSGVLAPLAYLQNIPPPRRHPLDEKALMSLPGLT